MYQNLVGDMCRVCRDLDIFGRYLQLEWKGIFILYFVMGVFSLRKIKGNQRFGIFWKRLGMFNRKIVVVGGDCFFLVDFMGVQFVVLGRVCKGVID